MKHCSLLMLSVTVALVCYTTVLEAAPETVEHGAHKTQHYKAGVHNPVFDQEALLGSYNDDEELADLSDEVRLKRLRILAKSHDKNNNDIIEADELKEWVLQSFRMLDTQEAREKFEEDDENDDKKVTLGEILEKGFGLSDEQLAEFEADQTKPDDENLDTYQVMLEDKKRFNTADLNKDGSLDFDEYMAYFTPGDYPHMQELDLDRSMADLDKDGDGFVSKEEFTRDFPDEEGRPAQESEFEDLDKDKDGKLSREELRPWAVVDNESVAQEEVEHLVMICDEDHDGHLSVEEIVKKEDEFMSSSATDYGRHMHFIRDEL